MNTVTKVAIAGGVAGGAFLTYDFVKTRNQPGPAGQTVIERGIDAVRNTLPTSLGGPSGRLVRTPYPTLQMQPRMVIEGTSSNRSLFGIQDLANEICGAGSAPIVAGLASCESMNGSLQVQCFNCNLFGLHISPEQIAAGRPYIISNNEKFLDFMTGAPSQVEGFKACMRYFFDWLQSRTPNAIAPMRSGQWEAFETAWAPTWGASLYQRDLVNGAAVRSTLRDRYNRCVADHLAG